jgi:ankyrin repeat protein
VNATDVFGDTPIHFAAKGSKFDQVTEFLREIVTARGDLNRVNIKGQSALELLVEKGNLPALRFCHEHNLRSLEV